MCLVETQGFYFKTKLKYSSFLGVLYCVKGGVVVSSYGLD